MGRRKHCFSWSCSMRKGENQKVWPLWGGGGKIQISFWAEVGLVENREPGPKYLCNVHDSFEQLLTRKWEGSLSAQELLRWIAACNREH